VFDQGRIGAAVQPGATQCASRALGIAADAKSGLGAGRTRPSRPQRVGREGLGVGSEGRTPFEDAIEKAGEGLPRTPIPKPMSWDESSKRDHADPMFHAYWQERVKEALDSANSATIQEAYVAAWKGGATPTMDAEAFDRVFSGLGEHGIDLVLECPAAKHSVARVVRGSQTWAVANWVCVAAALEAVEWDWCGLWRDFCCGRLARAGRRLELARGIITAVHSIKGRAGARRAAAELWRDGALEEEEKEGLLDRLGAWDALSRAFIEALGPDAVEAALRMEHRGHRYMLDTPPPVPPSFPQAGTALGRRLTDLVRAVELAADVSSAGLTPEERDRLRGPWPGSRGLSELRRALRHSHPMGDELATLLAGWCPLRCPCTEAGGLSHSYRLPLVRLLHMAALLQAPSLAAPRAIGGGETVWYAVLHLLSHGGAQYVPGLRIEEWTDRTWRRRWVETMGEAVGVLFLEDAVGLKFDTLARIPSGPAGWTPDFTAETGSGDRAVIEAKGNTSWKAHRSSRKQALGQLGKGPGDGGRVRGEPWASSLRNDRAFASCLYAATRLSDRPSLLHLADPPVDFGELFHEGWQHRARRQHYAAVLETAGLYGYADALLRHRLQQGNEGERAETFSIRDGEGRDGTPVFMGTYRKASRVARELGHPSPETFEELRLFAGVDNARFEYLRRGDIPAHDIEPREQDWAEREAPSVGVLPGREAGGPPCGVYSLLPDGAFFAAELQ